MLLKILKEMVFWISGILREESNTDSTIEILLNIDVYTRLHM